MFYGIKGTYKNVLCGKRARFVDCRNNNIPKYKSNLKTGGGWKMENKAEDKNSIKLYPYFYMLRLWAFGHRCPKASECRGGTPWT
jgi:hypothetical protein